MPPSRRDHLLDTALQLFYRGGFHATGIDTILDEAGVAKMTLYHHFKSKDELILAALRRRDEMWRNSFERSVERASQDPRERLLAIFDVLEAWFRGDFYGCLFINASAEFGQRDDPIHEAAAEHKRLVHRYVTLLAEAAGAPDPPMLAGQLCLLIEGAIVLAHIDGDPKVARQAKDAARELIDAALGGANDRPRPEKKRSRRAQGRSARARR